MAQTQIRRIAVLSPGDMGQAVAIRLRELGFEVGTVYSGRSERTQGLARAAGLADWGDLRGVLDAADLVLSIVDPGAAVSLARDMAALLPSVAAKPLVADCNALSPATKQQMQGLIEGAGARFIDAAIIGPPPRGAGKIRFYASGAVASALLALAHEAIAVRVVSDRIGDAASVKMCYGGITKGTVALLTELLVAAKRLGVDEVLDEELRGSQSMLREWILRALPSMPPKAYRWVPETREIAATFASAGLTPLMMEGAAAMYEGIALAPAGRESPEQARERGRSGVDVIAALDGSLPPAANARKT